LGGGEEKRGLGEDESWSGEMKKWGQTRVGEAEGEPRRAGRMLHAKCPDASVLAFLG
jgi:hypothetical protein